MAYTVQVDCLFDISKLNGIPFEEVNSWFEEVFTKNGTSFVVEKQFLLTITNKTRIATIGFDTYPDDKFVQLCDKLKKFRKEGVLVSGCIVFEHRPSKLVSTYKFHETGMNVARVLGWC